MATLLWISLGRKLDALHGEQSARPLVKGSIDLSKSSLSNQIVLLVLKHYLISVDVVEIIARDQVIGHGAE